MSPADLNPDLRVHLARSDGSVLCGATGLHYPPDMSVSTLHNVNCARCLWVATDIVQDTKPKVALSYAQQRSGVK